MLLLLQETRIETIAIITVRDPDRDHCHGGSPDSADSENPGNQEKSGFSTKRTISGRFGLRKMAFGRRRGKEAFKRGPGAQEKIREIYFLFIYPLFTPSWDALFTIGPIGPA